VKKIVGKGLYYATDWRIWYVVVLVGLIQMYPVAVSDGQDNSNQLPNSEELSNSINNSFDVRGIDISHHNNEIDWAMVGLHKGDKQTHFCFMKATEGGDFVDKRFVHNWSEAKRHDIAKGAYHFYRPDVAPEIQAKNFIRNVWLDEGDFAPVLDFEIQGHNRRHCRHLTENVTKWLKMVETAYGIKPIIYTNLHIYNQYIKGTPLDKYPIWASQYNTEKLIGFDGANVFFWQHSQTGRTAGIIGDVDHNVYLGTYLDLFTLKVKHSRKVVIKEIPA
jgi:lysozyme